MEHTIKRILFASDLSTDMKQVFRWAAVTAIAYNASIDILHVLEEIPSAKRELTNILGKHEYSQIRSDKKEKARESLVGKNIEAQKIRQAIAELFTSPDSNSDSLINNIIVSEGSSIAGEIQKTALNEQSDIIVLGHRKQGVAEKIVGDNVVKRVLKRSSMPVLVVPIS